MTTFALDHRTARVFATLVCSILTTFSTFSTTWVRADRIDFNTQIRPLLAQHCFTCHGPDESQREADFRIDNSAGAYFAIEPGDPENSEVYLRIISEDDDRMPPPEHNDSLSKAEIELIKAWISEGARYETHWAFVSPIKVKPPAIESARANWPRNEIDKFISAKLRERNLTPSLESDPHRLIRRVALDLTGLPPSLEMVERFVRTPTDETYGAIIDELLSSPFFGEHWTSMWLDMARYADTAGYAEDRHRTIWPWRDWVIRAFDSNMPFDQFTIEQIAGDLLPNADTGQKLATAFHRNTLNNSEGGTDDEEFRMIAVKDRANTTLNVWMGITFRCAECHSHKYDPISQTEYYQFMAFFNQTMDNDQTDDRPFVEVYPDGRKDPLRVPAMVERGVGELRSTHVLTRGSYLQPAEEVSAAVIAAFHPFSEDWPRNRLGVAYWLVADENPLTARVTVNRFWARLFGIGIVETEEDFGTQGNQPTHPQLLDWLAVDFRDNGWDVKRLLKQIVMSSTYRQSAIATKERLELDPRNLYLSRGPHFRLRAEVVRDQALAVSGLLSSKKYGPPVYPANPVKKVRSAFQGETVWTESQGEDRYRRTLYTYLKRTAPHPLFQTFDMATREVCNLRRIRTNTPLQSFMTLNGRTFMEAAQALAVKMNGSSSQVDDQIVFGYRAALLRPCDDKQLESLVKLYEHSIAYYREAPGEAKAIISAMSGMDVVLDSLDSKAAELASLTIVANAILNLDSFLTR